jgi:hypothetical protein
VGIVEVEGEGGLAVSPGLDQPVAPALGEQLAEALAGVLEDRPLRRPPYKNRSNGGQPPTGRTRLWASVLVPGGAVLSRTTSVVESSIRVGSSPLDGGSCSTVRMARAAIWASG